MQAPPQNSCASAVTPSATQGVNASQTHQWLTGQSPRPDPKTKQRVTTPQGVHNIVAGILESRGMSQVDWDQSLKTDYWVNPLHPLEWSVRKPPGMHLSTMEGASVDKWHAEPNVTADQLLRQLTQLANQAFSYQSQKSYFRHSQRFKETMRDYEAKQGLQYHDRPVHVDSKTAGSIIAAIAHLQWELQETRDGRQEVKDRAIDANVHRYEAENESVQLKRDLFGAEQGMLEAQGTARTARKYEKLYHETLVELEWAQKGNPTLQMRQTGFSFSRWRNN